MSGEGVGEAYVRREARPRWDRHLAGGAKAKAVLSRRLIYHRFEVSDGQAVSALRANVCFWHLADVRRTCPNVRFLCKSGHSNKRVECPLLTLGEHRLTIGSGGERGAGPRQI